MKKRLLLLLGLGLIAACGGGSDSGVATFQGTYTYFAYDPQDPAKTPEQSGVFDVDSSGRVRANLGPISLEGSVDNSGAIQFFGVFIYGNVPISFSGQILTAGTTKQVIGGQVQINDPGGGAPLLSAWDASCSQNCG